MPYSIVRSEVLARFLEVNQLLNAIKNLEDSVTPPAMPPLEYKLLKGFFYVHIYACIEFSMHKLIVNTLTLIKAKNIRYVDFENSFYTVAASSSIQSLRDCSSKVIFDKSADLFITIDKIEVSNFDETLLSKYLQNIWGKSFNQVTKTIGASSFPITGQESAIFDEIVDNRNKVAHGRDNVENVGSGPTYLDLKNKYDKIFEVISRYIDHFNNYYSAKEFIKPMERLNY
ncbi:MAE_28990/MAE_18760 family HEPN-like nuclease [Anditalea andensis]|uniref:RiboL-PSP-HEPN domain-containing protein n=1 Tax=Anditalea andensis TaxID=1048983 RepID=A0A074LEP9_9BACT|nr:MAE_28990/MAE_18760 family HEPN-like nuclease [Anditalea andensis]KEO72267.1 hypothetical protein EL17_18650 [Anditalea andensis]